VGQEQSFFDFAAEVGLTKHLGGMRATEELVELCHIGQGRSVLDVGCGAGVTPCYLAKSAPTARCSGLGGAGCRRDRGP
jgi:cyclopropane fatty-acyl-phospholipid synthase-like methyltransferase